jgi:hypothetical protein
VSEGHRCGAGCLQTEADRGRNGGGGVWSMVPGGGGRGGPGGLGVTRGGGGWSGRPVEVQFWWK